MPPPRSLASPKVCGAGELDVPLHLYPQPLVCRLVGGREGCGCEVDKELPSQFLFFLAPTPAAPFNPISPCAHTLDFATAPGQGSLRGRPRVLPFEQRRTVQAWTQSTKPARHCSRPLRPAGAWDLSALLSLGCAVLKDSREDFGEAGSHLECYFPSAPEACQYPPQCQLSRFIQWCLQEDCCLGLL